MIERLPHVSELLKLVERKPNKLHARSTWVDGFFFPSQREADVYQRIKMLQGNDIAFFLRQVPFHLPGNTAAKMDFMTFDREALRHIKVYDAKGMRTASYIRNKKQVEDLYPVRIIEI
jgi:hypothetical protein